jgi:hypothetical protein
MWAGDVWKLIPMLKAYRPDLWASALWVRSKPTGCLILVSPDPQNMVLRDNYVEILTKYLAPDYPVMPSSELLAETIDPLEALDRLKATIATRRA